MLATAACTACASTTTTTPAQKPFEPPQNTWRPAVQRVDTSPWSFRWDAGAERSRLPSDAAGLEAEYARVCGAGSTPKLTGSPLLRYRQTSYDTSSGVVVVLSPLAGTRDSLLAELRCHQLGIVMAPFGVEGSPFDVPGLVIDAAGDKFAISLMLTTRDPADLGELQRRVDRQVEESLQAHHEE
jgi:hypothetical protein